MVDIFEKIQKNRGPLGMHAKDAHGYFTFPKLEGDISNKMVFRGKEKLVVDLQLLFIYGSAKIARRILMLFTIQLFISDPDSPLYHPDQNLSR